MTYDAEATRRRIFDAATAEFAAHGLAGARIERIALKARANKQAIYLYFGGKEKLFGEVVRCKVDEVCHGAALRPDDFAEAVGRLFDWYGQNPELVRLLLWEALESGGEVEGLPERREDYRARVRDFHAAGVVRAPAGEEGTRVVQDRIFTVIGLVVWNFAVPQLRRLVLDEDDDEAALARRRASVVETARALAEAGIFT
ncbi:TetR family transcriptional regulator [Actinomadura nitritigenes]|uniref:TetR family transcriptional regulator n=1 Tax=Actinomadura nitritigenes TaxID=134602 RepID=A0ABS3RDA3_9ACTN|nr:TetR family transcriptional regulator [Actinomadura nitritigenes]MBO2444207.1 TetR family transcriptional regulator [Actinomadura nitritigenes]